jgi:hypothetical protein
VFILLWQIIGQMSCVVCHKVKNGRGQFLANIQRKAISIGNKIKYNTIRDVILGIAVGRCVVQGLVGLVAVAWDRIGLARMEIDFTWNSKE